MTDESEIETREGRVCQRSFNITVNGFRHSFVEGDTVPDEIADEVKNGKVFIPREPTLPHGVPLAASNTTTLDEEDFESPEEIEDEFSELTVAQLKQELDEQEIEYSPKAKKPELLKLLRGDADE